METKPGYKTTEFWVTIVALGISVLAGMGVIGTEAAADIQTTATGVVDTVQQIILEVTGLVASLAYILSRAGLKSGQ